MNKPCTSKIQGGDVGDDWARLGRTVEHRRHLLDLAQEELTKRGGPSHQTVRKIERGIPGDYRRTTFVRLDRSLCWPAGTAEKILAGTATDEEIATVETWPGTATDDAVSGIREQPPPIPRPGVVSVQALVRADLEERERVGIQRYGTPLQPYNGRDALWDAYEECLDLAVYLRQAIAERDGR